MIDDMMQESQAKFPFSELSAESIKMWRPEQLRDRLRESPFRPLAFYDSLNRRYEIRHPEMAMVGERDVVIGLPSSKVGIHSQTVTVALMHIVRWEDLPASNPPATDGNGSTSPAT
jgi:hypothetical protein